MQSAPVEAAVLDEDFVCVIARSDDAGDEQAVNIRFHRFGIESRSAARLIDMDPHLLQEAVIRMVADHREDEIVWYRLFRIVYRQFNFRLADLIDDRIEQHRNLAVTHQPIEFREDPRFHTFE